MTAIHLASSSNVIRVQRLSDVKGEWGKGMYKEIHVWLKAHHITVGAYSKWKHYRHFTYIILMRYRILALPSSRKSSISAKR